MRIIVTGGCGFIGSHVVARLYQKRHQVHVFDDLSTGKLENIQHLLSTKKNGLEFELCDVRDEKHLNCTFESFKPELVIHLAAQPAISTSLKEPVKDAQVNTLGTLNVINAAKEYGVQKIIFSSTSAVYRERWGKLRENDTCVPNSPYGISKLAGELYLRTLFPNSVILRFGNVYGPLQVPLGENQVIPRIISHFKYGADFKIFGNGKQTRDWVYVEDVAEAVDQARLAPSRTYNVSGGTRTSVNRVAEMLAEIYGAKGYRFEHSTEQDPRRDIQLDVTAAAHWMDWKAHTKFVDGLKKTMEWWEGRYGKQ